MKPLFTNKASIHDCHLKQSLFCGFCDFCVPYKTSALSASLDVKLMIHFRDFRDFCVRFNHFYPHGQLLTKNGLTLDP